MTKFDENSAAFHESETIKALFDENKRITSIRICFSIVRDEDNIDTGIFEVMSSCNMHHLWNLFITYVGMFSLTNYTVYINTVDYTEIL